MTAYIIIDCYKKTDEGIYAIYLEKDRALLELSRDDDEADGFYMIEMPIIL